MIIGRPIYLNKLKRYKDKDLIKVITGVRRSGKSILLFEIFYNYLISEGVDKKHILKFNLENEEEKKYRDSSSLYNEISIQKTDNKRYYVFIDEIQYIDNFEDLVNSLKNNNCDVYITGSNSKMLSSDISTALRGRSIEIKVYPLSFKEYYSFVCGDKKAAWNQYIKYGGFPFLATEKDEQSKIEYLNMLDNTIATKDIIDRYKIRNPDIFNAVYNFLCSNICSLVSSKKIEDTLKSSGYSSVTADTISNYLKYLCDSYMFYKVYRYDIKGKEYLKSLNKYYISDLGIRNSHLNYRQIEVSHTLENIVYLELIRRGYIVDIGKNNEKEIDFYVKSAKETYYIQVAYSLSDIEVKNRELSSFYKLDDGYKKIVITMDDDPFILLENGYRKLNTFDFLLNDDSLEKI